MLNIMAPTTFKNVRKSNQIATNIGQRILKRIANAGLRGEIHDTLWFVFDKRFLHRMLIGNIDPEMTVGRMINVTLKPCGLQRRIVVVVMVVDTYNLVPAIEEAQSQCRTDESCRARD